jgi:hypothetical protein
MCPINEYPISIFPIMPTLVKSEGIQISPKMKDAGSRSADQIARPKTTSQSLLCLGGFVRSVTAGG